MRPPGQAPWTTALLASLATFALFFLFLLLTTKGKDKFETAVLFDVLPALIAGGVGYLLRRRTAGDAAIAIVEFERGGVGKVRSFSVGLVLSILTLGLYYYFWWYLINEELKDIGIAKGDQSLAESSPTNSVIAVLIGWVLIAPPLISVYNAAVRIKRAQRLCGIKPDRTIDPAVALLLLFPGGLLILPMLIHYWYLTKHQNAALRAAGGLEPWG
jgi:hypothetical protein